MGYVTISDCSEIFCTLVGSREISQFRKKSESSPNENFLGQKEKERYLIYIIKII